MSGSGWIGVDLDGTLAHYGAWAKDGGKGAPIPKMFKGVKIWLDSGETVKITTARVSTNDDFEKRATETHSGMVPGKHLGQELEVTNEKDFAMIEPWDDRAIGAQ